jgi:hypothetical protein
MMWTLEEALELIRSLQDPLARAGYGVGLAGGVLINGKSDHDLDVIVYPLDSTVQNRRDVERQLIMCGLDLKFDLQYVRKMWAKKKSHDQKHVEVWEDSQGRRIDIFLLS